jgi:hypothetical protein
VVPLLRASDALTASAAGSKGSGSFTGAYISLTDGGDKAERGQWRANMLEAGLFHSASRFRIIERYPDPPEWLEVFETDDLDPLTAYARSLQGLSPNSRSSGVRQRMSGSFQLVSAYAPDF